MRYSRSDANRSTLYIPVQPQNPTVQCIFLAHLTPPVLAFSMLQRLPAQFLKVVPRPHASLSLSTSAGCLVSPFVFITIQIPFPANPLYSHRSKSPRGVDSLALGFDESHRQRPQVPHFHKIGASWRFFCRSLRLESVTYSLFPRNTGGWGRVSAYKSTRTLEVQTPFRPFDAPSASRTGSRDVPTVCSHSQRGRRPHIQLSLFQGHGSQVHG